MKKKRINEYDDFLNERFNRPSGYTKEFIQGLLAKAKKLIPQEKIDQFIKDNKEEVEKMAELLQDENGELDMSKVKDLMNKNNR